MSSIFQRVAPRTGNVHQTAFNSLPIELRLQIYSYLLPETDGGGNLHYVRLTQTSRQIYKEVSSAFYGSDIFRLRLEWRPLGFEFISIVLLGNLCKFEEIESSHVFLPIKRIERLHITIEVLSRQAHLVCEVQAALSLSARQLCDGHRLESLEIDILTTSSSGTLCERDIRLLFPFMIASLQLIRGLASSKGFQTIPHQKHRFGLRKPGLVHKQPKPVRHSALVRSPSPSLARFNRYFVILRRLMALVREERYSPASPDDYEKLLVSLREARINQHF